MQINITGRHTDLTDALHSYVNKKLEKLSRHYDNITSAHVILSVEKLDQTAEARLHVPGEEVFAESTDSDMYTAIDLLVSKLDRQLIRHKEKHQRHGHKFPKTS